MPNTFTLGDSIVAAIITLATTIAIALWRSRASAESVDHLSKGMGQFANAAVVADLDRDLEQHKKEDREDFNHLRSAIEAVRTEIRGDISALRSEVGSMAAEFRAWVIADHLRTMRPVSRKSK